MLQLHDSLPCLLLHRAFRAARPSIRAPPSQIRLLRPLLLAAAAPWGSRAWTCPLGWRHCSRRRPQALQLHCRCAVMWVLYHLLAGHNPCHQGVAIRLTWSRHHCTQAHCDLLPCWWNWLRMRSSAAVVHQGAAAGHTLWVPLRLWSLRSNTPGSLAQCSPRIVNAIKTHTPADAGAATAPAAADARRWQLAWRGAGRRTGRQLSSAACTAGGP